MEFINPKRVVVALKSLQKILLVALIVKFGLTSSHKYRKYNLCFQRKLDFFLCLLIVSIWVGEEKALFSISLSILHFTKNILLSTFSVIQRTKTIWCGYSLQLQSPKVLVVNLEDPLLLHKAWTHSEEYSMITNSFCKFSWGTIKFSFLLQRMISKGKCLAFLPNLSSFAPSSLLKIRF